MDAHELWQVVEGRSFAMGGRGAARVVEGDALPGGDPAPALPVSLAEGYYLDNFWHILQAAQVLYEDLFSAEERLFLVDFESLSLGAQRLFVRLLSRRGTCFRLDRVVYEEIPLRDEALEELRDRGFVDGVDALTVEELLALMHKPELLALASTLGLERGLSGLRKDALVARICEVADDLALREVVAARVPMLMLLRWEHTLIFRLFTFGSLSYDLTNFVLQELGVVVYESYPILRDHRIFPDRDAVEEALLLSQTRDAISLLLDADATGDAIAWATPLLDQTRPWAATSRRYLDQIFNRVGRVLERRGDDALALSMLGAALAPPSRERQARIYLAQGELAASQALCDAMRASPRDETEAPVAVRIEEKIRRAQGEVVPRRKRARRRTITMTLARGEEGVEASVLGALAVEGKPGFHAENGLWRSLFGLAFWDIIFAAVPGAFQHPFQRGPLDLHHEEFRARRAGLFEQRLVQLHAPNWQALLRETYEEKCGIANAFVDWVGLTMPLLNAVLAVLPGPHLAVICDRLSRDVRRYRRGFPDLFVFCPDAPYNAPQYELLEVKGPGDQLRPEQSAWLDTFAGAGIPAAIVKVVWG